MAVVSKKLLLEAGVHFGHNTRRWNPKMKEYIYEERNGIYIIDLTKTEQLLDDAYKALYTIAQNNGSILFVGTRKQTQDVIKEEATRAGMFYVDQRWLGGTLTNNKTIQKSIAKLNEIEKMEETGKFELLPKKEVAKIQKEYEISQNEFHNEMEKINREIRKDFGTSCNCFLSWDYSMNNYRFTFTELDENKKPTEIINEKMNLIFFNSLLGPVINKEATEQQLKSFYICNLNYFKDRKRFLFSLVDMFIKDFNKEEYDAINEANKWQRCLLCAAYDSKSDVKLCLDVGLLSILPEEHPLARMSKPLDTLQERACRYKILDLNMKTLTNTLLLYSQD